MITPEPFNFVQFKLGRAAVTRSGQRVLWNEVEHGEADNGDFFCVINNEINQYVNGGINVNSNKRMDLFMVKTVNVDQMTHSQALHWLLVNDPEYDWIDEEREPGLVDAVCDNLSSYGEKHQRGYIHATFEYVEPFTISVFIGVNKKFTPLSPKFENQVDAEIWLSKHKFLIDTIISAIDAESLDLESIDILIGDTHNPSGS